MKREFIKIKELRIRISTIKKYKVSKDFKFIHVYYNTSRTKVEVESFEFPSKKETDKMLMELDLIFEDSFIDLNGCRIKMNTIKKISLLNGVKINLYYSPAVSKLTIETFTFGSEMERNLKMQELDIKFGIIF